MGARRRILWRAFRQLFWLVVDDVGHLPGICFLAARAGADGCDTRMESAGRADVWRGGRGDLLLAIPSAVPAAWPRMITDAAGRQWLMADLFGNCVLVSVFVMGPLALIASARAGASTRGRGKPEPQSSLYSDRVGVA